MVGKEPNFNQVLKVLNQWSILVAVVVIAAFFILGKDLSLYLDHKKLMESRTESETATDLKQEGQDDRMLKRLIIEERKKDQDGMKKYIFQFGQFEQVEAETFFRLGLFDYSLLEKGGNILNGGRYEYDKEGKLIDFEEYVPKYDDNSKLIRIDYNFVSSHTYVEYEYDEDGNMIKQTYEGGRTTTYEYDEKGNILKKRTSDNSITEYKYDADGNMLGETVLDEDGSVRYAVENQYELGTDILLEKTNYGSGRSFINRVEYIYDREGRLIQELSFDDQENPVSVECEYDEAGNLRKKTIYDNGKEISCREYEYNEDNLVTKEVYYDWNSDGSKTYEYDDTGDLIVKTYFDKEGTVTTQYKYQYEYY